MDDVLVSQNSTAAAGQAEAREMDVHDWDTPEFGRARGNWVVNGYLGVLFAVAAAVQILSTMGVR